MTDADLTRARLRVGVLPDVEDLIGRALRSYQTAFIISSYGQGPTSAGA